MPTPVGHVLGGLAVYAATGGKPLKKDLTFAAVCVGVSLLPDLDFALGPLTGQSYHHYFSHSLGFATLFGLGAYLIARASHRSKPLRDAGILFAIYLSHIFLDLLAKDPSPPFGVQLLWPFSGAFYISPFLIFNDVWRGTLGKLFGLHNWLTVVREVVIIVPVGAVLWWWRNRSKHLDRHGDGVSAP